MEVAIDLALQASPDHPWVKEHPEWFTTRADGSIAYAENPPKKYQDIYPLNFDNDPEGIYAEIERIVRLWMSHGVRIFRVDNPHTKPVRFWERLLAAIRQTDPDVLFLAEAFTRPAMMATLGMIGFHQSYTYFTWRNTSDELTEYLRELSGPASAYMRPNFFANTPDILHEYLQHGGPAAFKIRAVLAAMLSPSWGIYSGYELCENTPLRPGSEEYLDSEKYQYRPRDWDTAARDGLGISGYIADLNRIRRSHVALHWLRNLRFHHVDQPELICFSKRVNGASTSTERPSGEATPRAGRQGGDAADTVLVVVNLDPHQAREATVWLDMPALGMDWHDGLSVTDERRPRTRPGRSRPARSRRRTPPTPTSRSGRPSAGPSSAASPWVWPGCSRSARRRTTTPSPPATCRPTCARTASRTRAGRRHVAGRGPLGGRGLCHAGSRSRCALRRSRDRSSSPGPPAASGGAPRSSSCR